VRGARHTILGSAASPAFRKSVAAVLPNSPRAPHRRKARRVNLSRLMSATRTCFACRRSRRETSRPEPRAYFPARCADTISRLFDCLDRATSLAHAAGEVRAAQPSRACAQRQARHRAAGIERTHRAYPDSAASLPCATLPCASGQAQQNAAARNLSARCWPLAGGCHRLSSPAAPARLAPVCAPDPPSSLVLACSQEHARALRRPPSRPKPVARLRFAARPRSTRGSRTGASRQRCGRRSCWAAWPFWEVGDECWLR
jgi:hypothetical protein